MKKIAVTGGIGSGKSTVLKILSDFGYPVFSCDEVYKEVILDPVYIKKIYKNFPNCVENNIIDKKKLAKEVFSNSEKRARLNSIAHPMIIELLLSKMKATPNDIAFAEVPLLFEENLESLFDGVIVVLRKESDRIESICKRDNCTQKEALARIAAQFDYQNWEKSNAFNQKGVYTLYNNDDVFQLKNETISILKNFL